MVRSAKILLIVPALVSLLALSAFAASTATPTHPARLIYFIISSNGSPYMGSMQKAAEKASVHFSDLALTIMNAHNSASEEISDINAAVAAGAKGIILDPVQESVVAAARAATSRGIPLITVDRDFTDTSARMAFVGADEENVGRMETQYAVDYLGRHHVSTPWNVAVLQGTEGLSESAARLKGAMDVLQPLVEKGAAKIVLNASANFSTQDAQGMMRRLLTDNGTGYVQLVVCGSDAEALGAINAVMEIGTGLGTRTFVVGANANPQGLQAVRDGIQLDTVTHSPYVEAYWAVEAMHDYLLNGTRPSAAKLPNGEVTIPLTLVTRANAPTLMDWGTPRVITSLPYGPSQSYRVSMH